VLPLVPLVVVLPELPELPVPVLEEDEPELYRRSRFFVVENEFPSASFHVICIGTLERSVHINVRVKLEKSSEARDPIA
jgi:hypothetical protein